METGLSVKQILRNKGVDIRCPESVFINSDVDPGRISGRGVVIHPGTRITGEKTLIMEGCEMGREAPVTLDNVCLGPKVKLKGGFFQGAVFLGRNEFGSGAHVRSGTILEEEASAAHTVGLKQTILFPFVTLGSLINFCDCLMAGGTSRKDHSEVGSSFIHFNYTPNQDKATPSMMGNVHQGVMLRSRPIFLGGQGGLVGPARIAFGCVTAAGTICRRDELRKNRIILGGSFKDASIPRKEGVYQNVTRIFNSNIAYIAGLMALKAWYKRVRGLFFTKALEKELHKAMVSTLEGCISERLKRLGIFCAKLEESRAILLKNSGVKKSNLVLQHERAMAIWAAAEESFKNRSEVEQAGMIPSRFLDALEQGIRKQGKNYISVIQGLDSKTAELGSSWLESLMTGIIEKNSIQNLKILLPKKYENKK